jgi:type II secretory pathway pseudopilin PulG
MRLKKEAGLTITELIIVMGMFGVLTMLATTNLLRPQTQASIDSALYTLVADMRQQQLNAMVGKISGDGSTQPFGIHFEQNSYTLFSGTLYIASDPDNFIVDLETGVELTGINFPSADLVFAKNSGDVSGYSGGSDSVSITHLSTGVSKTLTVNRYGVVSIN